ncbi:major histocompatibility complex-like class I (lizard) [Squirrelpox virus]|uniref:Major histocompatibility complex-like class I (Lizard) n=1 Tax=Squirrelpox virus TaxID=240426 RepID=U3UBA0_9POXV|nr:major histocompatibility complex-like class I (lizard) [Squirrelpox virus]CCD83247.1 major histocompatibility complex-like class I (lizard) [Squirrelpox virus]
MEKAWCVLVALLAVAGCANAGILETKCTYTRHRLPGQQGHMLCEISFNEFVILREKGNVMSRYREEPGSSWVNVSDPTFQHLSVSLSTIKADLIETSDLLFPKYYHDDISEHFGCVLNWENNYGFDVFSISMPGYKPAEMVFFDKDKRDYVVPGGQPAAGVWDKDWHGHRRHKGIMARYLKFRCEALFTWLDKLSRKHQDKVRQPAGPKKVEVKLFDKPEKDMIRMKCSADGYFARDVLLAWFNGTREMETMFPTYPTPDNVAKFYHAKWDSATKFYGHASTVSPAIHKNEADCVKCMVVAGYNSHHKYMCSDCERPEHHPPCPGERDPYAETW